MSSFSNNKYFNCWRISRLRHRDLMLWFGMWKLPIMVSCGKWKPKRDKNDRLVELKMTETIKWFKRRKWWKLLGLPLSWLLFHETMATRPTSVGSLALYQKQLEIDHLRSSESIKERLWSFCLFASCTCSLEQIHRRVVPKAKNDEVANHPSRDAVGTSCMGTYIVPILPTWFLVAL